MHDIRSIRDNPKDFDKALGRRGVNAASEEILKIDEARRSAILSAEIAQAEMVCSPGLLPSKIGPISNKEIFSSPLSMFSLTFSIKFEKIDDRKTPKSELIGLISFIDFFEFKKWLLVISFVNDQVIASRYPLDATAL